MQLTKIPSQVAAPVASPAGRYQPIARAMITPRGFDGKQFDVVAFDVRSSGHASVADAIQAVTKVGQNYEVIGVVERPDQTFTAVTLVTVDDRGDVLDRLPLRHSGLDWISRISDTPLRAVYMLGDFGGPVELLDQPPSIALA